MTFADGLKITSIVVIKANTNGFTHTVPAGSVARFQLRNYSLTVGLASLFLNGDSTNQLLSNASGTVSGRGFNIGGTDTNGDLSFVYLDESETINLSFSTGVAAYVLYIETFNKP